MSLRNFLQEDIGSGDITSELLLTNEEEAEGEIIVNEWCVLAGLWEAREIFESLGLEVESKFKDGDKVAANNKVLRVRGNAKFILTGERTALNFLMRMSGIATYTRELVDKCRRINPNLEVAGTRKTTPGFRKWEKKAIDIGGGYPHRYGLYDEILIKDNHIKIVGSIKKCIERVKKRNKKIEIEASSVEDGVIAANAGADTIMLDNFDPIKAKTAYKKIKQINRSIRVEISGGITPENILEYVHSADIISLGRLTYGAKAIDFSLEIV